MARRKGYEFIYDPEVHRRLSAIDRRYHSLIRREIESSLRHKPDMEARNRKPLSRPSVLGTSWELRLGPQDSLRVFYRVDRASREVHILAIGFKRGNRLFVGGEEFDL